MIFILNTFLCSIITMLLKQNNDEQKSTSTPANICCDPAHDPRRNTNREVVQTQVVLILTLLCPILSPSVY